ncbi:CEP89 protein, partial [Xiphorhynchus elegans]|nr:CEP89 protein [Xiphorhynchus elegans]
KHIAHGLVPAATIAPKPAVPRTPPPRSPNPSPERPRSALAAAILTTTLTGRTVAIPQPRQRSLSESDSTSVPQEGFEPYATATELRIGSTWKLDGCDRSPVQSLEISGNYGEDEDMDTSLSDADKEAESSSQSNGKREESSSTNAIYAVPCKNKKVGFLNVLITLPCSNILVHMLNISDALYSPLIKWIEYHLNALYCDITDVSVRARQAWENVTKEKFRELIQENWSLNKAYQAVVQQFEGTKQQMEEQQLKLKKLEQENRRLKEAAENSHREEEATELHSLRQQAQELVDENDALKMVVHRLNVELSRYQTKFRSLSQEEHLKLKSLPMKGPPPPWLLDVKYLSPLLLAYEDRIREKEDFILEHEAKFHVKFFVFQEDMKNFKARVEELVKENEDLHEQLNKNNFITPAEWQVILLEINYKLLIILFIAYKLLRLEILRKIFSPSSKLLRMWLGRSQPLTVWQVAGRHLLPSPYAHCSKLKKSAELTSFYTQSFPWIQVRLQQEQEKNLYEVEDVKGKLASLQAENKKLLLERNNSVADKKIVETEMEMMQKTNRRLTKKISLLQLQLEEVMEKEIAAHHYLTNLIGLVEKIAQERDHLVFLASSLENEKQGVLNKMIEGSLRLGRLEEKVKVYKKKAAGKLGGISLKMSEQEKEFAGKIAQYEQEMKHLRQLLQDKQEALEEVLQQKR